MTSRRLFLLAFLASTSPVSAADVGITGAKLVVVDDPVAGVERLAFRAKGDAGIQKGPDGAPTALDATLEVVYGDKPCNYAFHSLPSGSGWRSNVGGKAKYRVASPTAKTSLKVRSGRFVRFRARAVGGDPNSRLGLVTGGVPSPAAGLVVVLTIRNAADNSVRRMCTRFAVDAGSALRFRNIKGGRGRKLVARNGQPTSCSRLGGVAMEAEAGRGFFSLPWPNDVRKTAAGTLDLAGYPGSSNAIGNRILTAGSAVTAAFGNNAAVFFQACGGLDAATLPSANQSITGSATALLVNLDSPSDPPVPLLADFKEAAANLRPARLLTLLPYPGHALRPASRYAAILFDGLTYDGQPLVPAPLLAGLDQAWDASKPVDAVRWAALQAQRDEVYDYVDAHTTWSASHVVAFSVFTTQEPAAEMQAIAAAVEALPAPTPVSRTLGNCSASGADRTTINGKLDLPKWQAGSYPFTNSGGGIVVDAGVAVQQSAERVDFQMTVPCGTAPANGWPIFVFMDGTGASAHSNYIPYVGVTGVFSPRLPYVVAVIAPLYSGDRSVAGLPPPYDQGEFLYFNYLNPLAGRTNQLQQAADMIYLRRVVEGLTFAASETATPGSVGTDDGVVVIGGHSQGALTVPHVLAVDDHFKGGFISAGGGGLYQTVLHRGDVRPLVDAFLGAAPGELDMFHPVPHALQTLAEAGDSANYAPLVDVAHVLSIGGLIDGCSPLEVVSIIGTGMGLPIVQPLVHPMFGALAFEPGTTVLPVTANLPGGRTGLTVELDTGHFGSVTNPNLGRSFLTSMAAGGAPTVNVAALFSDTDPGCDRYDPLP